MERLLRLDKRKEVLDAHTHNRGRSAAANDKEREDGGPSRRRFAGRLPA